MKKILTILLFSQFFSAARANQFSQMVMVQDVGNQSARQIAKDREKIGKYDFRQGMRTMLDGQGGIRSSIALQPLREWEKSLRDAAAQAADKRIQHILESGISFYEKLISFQEKKARRLDGASQKDRYEFLINHWDEDFETLMALESRQNLGEILHNFGFEKSISELCNKVLRIKDALGKEPVKSPVPKISENQGFAALVQISLNRLFTGRINFQKYKFNISQHFSQQERTRILEQKRYFERNWAHLASVQKYSIFTADVGLLGISNDFEFKKLMKLTELVGEPRLNWPLFIKFYNDGNSFMFETDQLLGYRITDSTPDPRMHQQSPQVGQPIYQ